MFFGEDSYAFHYFQYDRNELRGFEESELNCSLPAILEFPNMMRRKTWWAPVVCLFASLYIFVILAVVCDDYLLPAMERLCYGLKISYDVAGATFLAAATSAPELFVNFMGTFITQGDIGVGTIVGSSVFNILMIAAVCGLLTKSVKLDWWPVTRDTFWYLVAVVFLAGVMWDTVVTWYEALLLLSMYLVYFTQLLFDKKVQKLFRKEVVDDNQLQEDPMQRDSEDEELKTFRDHICGVPPKGSNCCIWAWWVFKYPAELILAITIPSVRTVYPLTIIVSIVWISIISYFVTWFLTIFGHNLGIPDSIMGLTILAVGTSVPEVVSSYIVSKKGYGSMAICNAIGSNTFNIMICLGLPWLLQSLIRGIIKIDSSALNLTTAILMITAILLYVTLLSCRFVLGKIVGCLSLISYILFLIIACAMEMLLSKLEICDIEAEGYESYLDRSSL